MFQVVSDARLCLVRKLRFRYGVEVCLVGLRAACVGSCLTTRLLRRKIVSFRARQCTAMSSQLRSTISFRHPVVGNTSTIHLLTLD